MTTNHTPGPWSTHLVDDTVVVIPRRPLPQKFSILGHSEVADEEDFANARLIAAAPELLQALQKLLDLRVAKEELEYLDRGIGTKTPNAAWLDARAAIAKARGEQ